MLAHLGIDRFGVDGDEMVGAAEADDFGPKVGQDMPEHIARGRGMLIKPELEALQRIRPKEVTVTRPVGGQGVIFGIGRNAGAIERRIACRY